VAYKYEALAKL